MENVVKKIFKSFDFSATAEDLRAQLQKFKFPIEYSNSLMDYMLERSYLEEIADRKNDEFKISNKEHLPAISWIRIDRLPIHPSAEKEFDIMSKWQSALSAIHAWGHRVVFLLKRKNGETHLYLGVGGSVNIAEGMARLKSAMINCMPGIDLHQLDFDECMSMSDSMTSYNVGGAITGIPSLRADTNAQVLQTLDQLAFGIRDINNDDANFSMMVIAD